MRMLQIRCGLASGSRGPGLRVIINEPQPSVHADRVRVVRVVEGLAQPAAPVTLGSTGYRHDPVIHT